MNKHTVDLIKYIAGGIGMLIFVGMLTWCHLTEKGLIKYGTEKPVPCDCRKGK